MQAIRDAGAELIEYGADFEAAGRKVEQRGLCFVHPANEPHLINGVGTEFIEIIEQLPDLDTMIVPIGAGARQSWKAGRVVGAPNTTTAGGVATGTAYALPFKLYRDTLADFILLSETELYEGIALAAHHTRKLAEAAGAACLRAAFKIRDRLTGKTVAIQMSGGNASGTEIRQAMDRPCLLDGSC